MEICQATKSNYDHKAARIHMSIEEKLSISQEAKKQRIQAVTDLPIDCAGENCERKLVLIWMFRCYFCERYFCPVCAKQHFAHK